MKTILIVEDDFIVSDNISSLLEEEGYGTIVAENGLKAFEKLSVIKPDLIISDIAMPEMNGFELLKRIRIDYDKMTIPVIFLTAKTEREYFRQAMNLGADDFITKPFDPDELLEAIESRLNRKNIIDKLFEESQENIIKNLPHELRTPLVPILGYSDLLLENIKDLTFDEIKSIAIEIKNSGNRLSGLVEKSILMTELLSTDKPSEIENAFTSINLISWQNNFDTSKEWYERKNDINIKLQTANIKIQCHHLSFIIREFVENSCKFSKPGSKIKLTGQNEGAHYKITIEDESNGLDESKFNEIKIFSQFERSINQQNGSGVGLAIIKKLMSIYGGEISILKNNQQTEIKVSLPLA